MRRLRERFGSCGSWPCRVERAWFVRNWGGRCDTRHAPGHAAGDWSWT